MDTKHKTLFSYTSDLAADILPRIFFLQMQPASIEQLADGHNPGRSPNKLSNISLLIGTYRFWFVIPESNIAFCMYETLFYTTVMLASLVARSENSSTEI